MDESTGMPLCQVLLLLVGFRFFMPHGIEVDKQGNIWLTDVALHQVRLLNQIFIFLVHCYYSSFSGKMMVMMIQNTGLSPLVNKPVTKTQGAYLQDKQ